MAKSGAPGMDTVGLIMVLIGVYLLTAAVKNHAPLETAKAIIANPGSARAIFTNSAGYETAHVTQTLPDGNTITSQTRPDPILNSASGVSKVIAFAEAQLGKPYVWGGIGTNNKSGGFDCSGLVISAWKRAGVSLPHYTGSLLVSSKLEKIGKSDLKAGDLVFPFPGHVQLYIGNGQIIEAPGRGRNIRKKSLGSVWQARRVKGSATV